MSFPQTVDITRQQIGLSAFPGLDTGAWFQDVLFKALFTSGLINGIVSDVAPGDTRKTWYQVSNPPTGAPGTPYVFDVDAQTWVPLSPSEFIQYLSVSTRSQIFKQDTTPTTAQNPQVGDQWFCTVDLRYYVYIAVAANTFVWLDTSGAALDGTTIAAIKAKTLAPTVSALPTIASVPTGTSYIVTDATAVTMGSIVAGGGANTVPVFSDGAVWRIG